MNFWLFMKKSRHLQDGAFMTTPRSLFWIFILVVLTVGVAGGLSLRRDQRRALRTFDAHEYALFHSTYGSLRSQSATLRADHFRKLVEVAESAELTAGMVENLIGFCRSVLGSEEALEVKAQARMALNSLEKRQGKGVDRSIARAQ
jgi:hypothetical protein